MKKTISVILALALCCLLIPAVAEEDSPVGIWYIGSAQADGMEIQVVDPEAIVLTINEDNTFDMASMGHSTPGAWTNENSALTLTPVQQEGAEQQEPAVFQLAGGELLYDIGTTVIHLSRTPAEPVVLPSAVDAASADAFDGYWKPAAQIMYGLYLATDETRAASLLIENGKLHLLYAEDGKMAPYGEYETAFADGVLTAEDHTFVSTVMTLSLQEDGSLFYRSVSDFGGAALDLTMVYVRTESEIVFEAENNDEADDEAELILDDFNGTAWESGDLKLEAVWQDGFYKIAIWDGDTELSYLCDLGMNTGYLFGFGTGIAELDGEQADCGRGIFFINGDWDLVWQQPDGTETVFSRIQ